MDKTKTVGNITNGKNHQSTKEPIVGILTFAGHIPNRLNYYKKYFLYNKSAGTLYVFQGKDIDTKSGFIKGYHYDVAKNTWKSRLFPFPDTVYDRCYPNNYSYHALLEKKIGQGKIFNKKTMITKKDFFQTISGNIELVPHLPETRVFKKTSDLTYLLEKYNQVFCKPYNAMKGNGIIALRSNHRGLIDCRYRLEDKDRVDFLQSPREITPIITSLAGTNRKYIIQQAIDGMEYQGGPFSMRVSPLKNRHGQWVITGIVALGSFGTSHITNYASGGKRIPLKAFYDSVIPRTPYSKEDFVDLIYNLALKTATALDQTLGPLCELGVDMIVDKKGKPWLLEANGNPAKVAAFIQDEYPLWPRQAYQYPVEYAVHLARSTHT